MNPTTRSGRFVGFLPTFPSTNGKTQYMKQQVIDFIISMGFKPLVNNDGISIYHKDYRKNADQVEEEVESALYSVHEKFGYELPFRVFGVTSKKSNRGQY